MNKEIIKNSEYVHPEGNNELTEKDRLLNTLAREYEEHARTIMSEAFNIIRMADEEVPEEHAEVDT